MNTFKFGVDPTEVNEAQSTELQPPATPTHSAAPTGNADPPTATALPTNDVDPDADRDPDSDSDSDSDADADADPPQPACACALNIGPPIGISTRPAAPFSRIARAMYSEIPPSAIVAKPTPSPSVGPAEGTKCRAMRRR